MKVIWTSVLIVAAWCGFQAATLRTSGSASVTGKDQWIGRRYAGQPNTVWIVSGEYDAMLNES